MILSAALLASSAAMAASTPPSPAAAPFRSLRLGTTGLKAATINPNTITLTLEFVVVYNIYSTLITLDAQYHEIPDLASKWGVARDNVTWTFNLVQDAYFTDPANPTDKSHPVTADDVVFSYNMIMGNTSSILYAYVSPLASVTKLGTYTVQIVTKAPYAAMNSTLTNIVIFPKYWWWDQNGITDPVKSEPPRHIGSGPVYLNPSSSLSRGPLILDRSPDYFGDAEYCRISRPNEVRIIYFSTSGAMVDSLKSGQDNLDGIFNVESSSFLNGLPPSGSAVPSPGQGVYLKWHVPSGFVGEIGLNQATPRLRQLYSQFRGSNSQLLLNQTVRSAVAMSTDNEAIVKYAYLGLATVGDSLVPAVNPWHYAIPANMKYPFDTAGARKMLNDAGWAFDTSGNPATSTTVPLAKAGGADPLVFRLYAPDSHPEFAVAVANMTIWLRQAGIQTTDSQGRTVPGYEVKPVNQMNTIWKTADWDMWLWDWDFAALAEVSTEILEVQTSMAIPNDGDTWYSNSTYDSLYNQSLVTVDPVARRAIVDEMQLMIYRYASYVIPYYADKLYAATNSSTLAYGWEGWGDFRTIPGAAPDSDLPNLYFQLYPHDNPPPGISAFPSIDYVAGSPVTINVIASDPNGEPMNFTWDFGDGTATQTTQTNSVSHTYAQPASYTIKVRVQDSEWPVCTTTTATIAPAGGNLPPQATLNYQLPATTGTVNHGWVNEPVTFGVSVSDAESNPLFISWDFGDGATNWSRTASSTTPQLFTVSHTYTTSGNFTLKVVVTDNTTGAGNHLQEKTAVIPIWTKSAGGGGGGGAGTEANPWINYGIPIAIILALVLAVVATIWRRRKVAKEEERKEEKEPPQPPPPP